MNTRLLLTPSPAKTVCYLLCALLLLLSPPLFARDNATPDATPISPEQLRTRLNDYAARLAALTPAPDPTLTTSRDEIVLKTALPAAKPVGAYDISMIAALAAATDRLTCIVQNIVDCENLPIADRAAPFAMSFSRGSDRSLFPYPPVYLKHFGPVEGQQTVSDAAQALLWTSFAHISWGCVTPNPFFTPEGTPVAAREKIEAFGQYLLALNKAVQEKSVSWDDAHPEIVARLSELLGAEYHHHFRKPDITSSHLPVGLISAEVIHDDDCESASRKSTAAAQFTAQTFGVLWWPDTTLPAGVRDGAVLPLLRVLLSADIMPLLEVCATPEDSAGRCSDTLTLAVTGSKTLCDDAQANCVAALRVVNTFDPAWGQNHPAGWISFAALARQLAAAPLRDSTVTWFQRPGDFPWKTIPGVLKGVNGDFNTRGSASEEAETAQRTLVTLLEDDATSIEEQLKKDSTLGMLKVMDALKPIDFSQNAIKPDSLIQLNSIPSDRNQGVMGICYSASVSAIGEQLYCRENHIADCQKLPAALKTSVVNSPSSLWSLSKLHEGGSAYASLKALSDKMHFNLNQCMRPSNLFEPATLKQRNAFLQLKFTFDAQEKRYLSANARQKKAMQTALRAKIKALTAITLSAEEMRSILDESGIFQQGDRLEFDAFLFRILVKQDCFDNLSKDDRGDEIDLSREIKRWPDDNRELPDMTKFAPVLQFLLQHNIMPEVSACLDDNAVYGSCEHGHSWTVKAVATICSKTQADDCFPAVQIMNWWGPQWQSARSGGWVRMDVFTALASKTSSPIAWLQSHHVSDPDLPGELAN